MIRDGRSMPKRFWEVYALTILFVALAAYAAASSTGWWLVFPLAVSTWGIFVSLMTVYRMGMAAAFRQAAAWAEEARREMLEHMEGTPPPDIEDVVVRLERPGQHFEGPS